MTTRPGVRIPEYQTDGSAGFDLAAAERVSLQPHKLTLVPTGLVIATPAEHVLVLAARSSLFKRRQCILANGIGIIDSDFCGPIDEIYVPLLSLSSFVEHLDQGERIAQGIILPVVRAQFEEAELTFASRGGFGSTGT